MAWDGTGIRVGIYLTLVLNQMYIKFFKIFQITDPTTNEKLAPPGKIYVNLCMIILG